MPKYRINEVIYAATDHFVPKGTRGVVTEVRNDDEKWRSFIICALFDGDRTGEDIALLEHEFYTAPPNFEVPASEIGILIDALVRAEEASVPGSANERRYGDLISDALTYRDRLDPRE